MQQGDEADSRVVESVLAAIQAGQIGSLAIDDLTTEDLGRISWSGSPLHVRSVEAELGRVDSGEVEYLALRAPGGEPVAKGEIDYAVYPDGGKLVALATRPQLQGSGLGTRLIAAAEARIARRRRRWSVLSVGLDNPRARALYERLGYGYWKREYETWEVRDERGTLRQFGADVVVLRKEL